MTKSPKEPTKESPILWIYRAVKPFHGVIVFISFLAILSAVISLWNTVLLKDLIDVAVEGKRDLLIRTAVILTLVTAFSIALSLYSRYLRERTTYRIINDLQTRLVSVLLSKDYYSVTRTHSQEWMNRINSDTTTVADAVCKMVPGVVGILFSFIGAFYLIAKAAPSFLIFMLIGGVALVGLNYALKNPLKQAQRQVRSSMGKKNIFVSEHLSKIMIVKSFGREETTIENAEGKMEELLHRRMQRLRLLLAKDAVQSGSTKIASLIVLIYCALKILRGEISYGTSVMLIKLLSQIRAPLTDVSNYLSNIFDVSVAAERLMEAEGFPEDTELPMKNDVEIRAFYEHDFKEIVFKDAGFSYLDELEENPNIRPTVFENVNLTIPKKGAVAFTGITGSGKSTFFKLLLSLYPLQEGSKILRCEDGRELPLDATYRRLFAYVPQGNQLMVGSIREMVSFGEKNVVDSEVWDVLEASCAKDFVEKLPQGLDTQIGERGLGLSEGQMQRLAIGRALYTKRPILLLDEATSSLDEATEKNLLENIKAMTDCTILIVTHRPAALSICDQRVHIDGNRVSVVDLNT